MVDARNCKNGGIVISLCKVLKEGALFGGHVTGGFKNPLEAIIHPSEDCGTYLVAPPGVPRREVDKKFYFMVDRVETSCYNNQAVKR